MKYKPETFVNAIIEAYENVNEVLMASPGNYYLNNSILNQIISFANLIVVPLCSSLLAIFLYQRIMQHFDEINSSNLTSATGNVKKLIWLAFSIGISVTLVSFAPKLLLGVVEFADALANKALGAGFGPAGGIKPPEKSEILGVIESSKFDLNILAAAPSFIYLFLAGAASMLAKVCVTVVLMSRQLSLYTLIALSPIAFTTIPSKKYNNIAEYFIKSFMAVALTSSVLVIALKVITVVIVTVPVEATSINDWCLNILVLSIVQITTILGAPKLAKNLLNVMG